MKKTLFLTIVMSLGLSGCTLVGQQSSMNTNTNVANTNIANTNEPSKPINNKVDLSNQQLKKVPDYVFKQTNLEELNLSHNQLTGAIQAEVRHLQNLRILRTNDNLLTGVPAEIGQLQKLEILDLSNNQLTGLPYELGNLKNLKTLNISGNNYSPLDLGIIMEKLPATVEIIK
jgi:Leucine-rich repeat (LRR) protein